MTTEVKTTMAEKGSWDDFSAEENNNSTNQTERSKTEYLTIDTSKPGTFKFTIRPVGPHIKCRKSFKPYKATLSDSDRNTDPAWKAGFYPQKRYAINVIDRADGKLKIMEKGASVFKQLANYKAVFGKNPSDAKEGADFLITVTVPKLPNGQPNKLKTEYAVTHLKETPLNEKEIEMIKAQKLWPLTEIYKSTPLEKRIEMWNSLPDAAKIAPKRPDGKDESSEPSEPKVDPKPAVKVEEKMPDAPANTEDLFEDKDGSAEKADGKDSDDLLF